MTRTRDPDASVNELFQDLMSCIQNTYPGKQLLAELMLAIIGLGFIQRRLTETRDLKERRLLKQEYQQGVKTLGRAIKLLRLKPRGSEPSSRQAARPGGLIHFQGR